MSSRTKPKFAADKIAKRLNKKQKEVDDELVEEKSSDAEESEFENEVDYNPSIIRDIDIPDVDVSKRGKMLDDGHAHYQKEATVK